MSIILLTSHGSLGDVHPYVAMGRALASAGHTVRLATQPHYEALIRGAGLEFVAVKPSLEDFGDVDRWAARINHPIRGSEAVVREIVLPYLRQNYDAYLAAAEGCALIISHILTFAAPLVAETRGIPWLSCALQPSVLFSATDPPAFVPLTILPRLAWLGPTAMRAVFAIMAASTTRWFAPLRALRAELGLAPLAANPLFFGPSPHGTLALFSRAFAPPQADWPPHTEQVGFPLFDEGQLAALSPVTQAFLAAGPPPVVFTLGSNVVRMKNDFYTRAYRAVRRTSHRAIFLVGERSDHLPAEAHADPRVLIATYEPFSHLFARAAAIVHQCGIGTTAQALAAGHPQILVPFSHDQPDNAGRVVRHGLGVQLSPRAVSESSLRTALEQVVGDAAMARRARDFAGRMEQDPFATRLVAAVDRLSVLPAATRDTVGVAPPRAGGA